MPPSPTPSQLAALEQCYRERVLVVARPFGGKGSGVGYALIKRCVEKGWMTFAGYRDARSTWELTEEGEKLAK